MKKTIIILFALLLAVGCTKDDETTPFRIDGITMDNYPKVDCSTSTQLLQTLIACKLLGVGHEWKENVLFGGITTWMFITTD